MKPFINRLLLPATLMLTLITTQAGATLGTIPVETESTPLGLITSATLKATDDGYRLVGRVNKPHAAVSRRIRGWVDIEFIDAGGETVALYQRPVHRSTVAKHNQRGRFSLSIEQLPTATDRILVRYHHR